MNNVVNTTATSVFDVVKALQTLDQQAIIRPLNPPPGVAGYLFDINEQDAVELRSTITDHYVENNTAIQDHIALAPEKVTVNGLVAELTNALVQPDRTAQIPESLPLVPELLPTYTPQAEQEQAARAATAAETVGAVTENNSLYSYFSAKSPTTPNQTKQAGAFAYFYNLWKGRVLCSVETPWGIWTNMAIEGYRAEQEADSRYKSNFKLTFKKIRFAGIVSVQVGQLAGRRVAQVGQSDPTQNGNAGQSDTTPEKRQSILYGWATKGVTP